MNLDNDFLCWAFGQNCSNNWIDRMDAWNNLHGDKMLIELSTPLFESFEKMHQLYEEDTKKK